MCCPKTIFSTRNLAGSFGTGVISDSDLASVLQGAVVKDDSKDKAVWAEYLENVMKKRRDCAGLYAECKERNS